MNQCSQWEHRFASVPPASTELLCVPQHLAFHQHVQMFRWFPTRGYGQTSSAGSECQAATGQFLWDSSQHPHHVILVVSGAETHADSPLLLSLVCVRDGLILHCIPSGSGPVLSQVLLQTGA